jgi:hypothetical protein
VVAINGFKRINNHVLNNALNTAVIQNRILISIFKILKMIIEKIADETMNIALKILFAATTRARCDFGAYACIMAYRGTI